MATKMTREEAVALLERYSNYEGMGIPNLAGCKEAMKVAVDALKEAFPELAESEDKRITRAINNMLPFIPDDAYANNGVTKGQVLAWLEKQKDEEGYEEIPVESTLEYKLGFKAGKDSEKQKEQKPAEWSEDIIQKAVKEVGLTQHQINWFKTNVFPPKQEWSEEDEDNLCRIIRVLEDNDSDWKELSNWLKSLRPSWKPSEEELAKKHLDGYCMGREDTLREMKDFVESHFNCENAKKGTPIVYNTQSGTSTLKAEG